MTKPTLTTDQVRACYIEAFLMGGDQVKSFAVALHPGFDAFVAALTFTLDRALAAGQPTEESKP